MKISKLLFSLIIVCFCFDHCQSQKPFGTEELKIKQTIPLPAVKGRMDHLDINLAKQIVYVAALGNNSLEIADLKTGKLLHSIKGLDEPQGVAFIPQANEVMVANGGNGKCEFFNADSFEKTATIDLGSDADDVRYDSIDKKIYVGYGDGGIAIIDALKHQKLNEIKLSAHPEGFQLDKKLKKLFVNVPGANEITVINMETASVIANWKTSYGSNFPMTIDSVNHFIFVGYRSPGKLVAINENTGAAVATADLVGDIDDLFYDIHSKKIYASGGSGAIDIYLFENSSLIQIAKIQTHSGARTSLLIPNLKLFVLAARAASGKDAELEIYNTHQ
jgi:hypothetical protein